HIDIAVDANGLQHEAEYDDAFDANAVGQDPEDDAAKQTRKTLDAINAGCGQRRRAAEHGIADRVEDRPGMGATAEEEYGGQDDELGRAENGADAGGRLFGRNDQIGRASW